MASAGGGDLRKRILDARRGNSQVEASIARRQAELSRMTEQDEQHAPVAQEGQYLERRLVEVEALRSYVRELVDGLAGEAEAARAKAAAEQEVAAAEAARDAAKAAEVQKASREARRVERRAESESLVALQVMLAEKISENESLRNLAGSRALGAQTLATPAASAPAPPPCSEGDVSLAAPARELSIGPPPPQSGGDTGDATDVTKEAPPPPSRRPSVKGTAPGPPPKAGRPSVKAPAPPTPKAKAKAAGGPKATEEPCGEKLMQFHWRAPVPAKESDVAAATDPYLSSFAALLPKWLGERLERMQEGLTRYEASTARFDLEAPLKKAQLFGAEAADVAGPLPALPPPAAPGSRMRRSTIFTGESPPVRRLSQRELVEFFQARAGKVEVASDKAAVVGPGGVKTLLTDVKHQQVLDLLVIRETILKKRSPNDIVKDVVVALYSCDYDCLKPAVLEDLHKVLVGHLEGGSSTVLDFVREHGRDSLQNLEHPHLHLLLLGAAEVPAVTARLECMKLESTFKDSAAHCFQKLDTLQEGMKRMQNLLAPLRQFFAAVRHFVNVLNQGSNAPITNHGFKLASLPKLAELRFPTRRDVSLLHLIVVWLHSGVVDALTDPDAQQALQKAQTIRTATAYQDCMQQLRGFRLVRNFVETGLCNGRQIPRAEHMDFGEDVFHGRMEAFEKEEVETAQQLWLYAMRVFGTYRDLGIYFDDLKYIYPPPSEDQEDRRDLFDIVSELMGTVEKARDQIRKQRLGDEVFRIMQELGLEHALPWAEDQVDAVVALGTGSTVASETAVSFAEPAAAPRPARISNARLVHAVATTPPRLSVASKAELATVSPASPETPASIVAGSPNLLVPPSPEPVGFSGPEMPVPAACATSSVRTSLGPLPQRRVLEPERQADAHSSPHSTLSRPSAASEAEGPPLSPVDRPWPSAEQPDVASRTPKALAPAPSLRSRTRARTPPPPAGSGRCSGSPRESVSSSSSAAAPWADLPRLPMTPPGTPRPSTSHRGATPVHPGIRASLSRNVNRTIQHCFDNDPDFVGEFATAGLATDSRDSAMWECSAESDEFLSDDECGSLAELPASDLRSQIQDEVRRRKSRSLPHTPATAPCTPAAPATPAKDVDAWPSTPSRFTLHGAMQHGCAPTDLSPESPPTTMNSWGSPPPRLVEGYRKFGLTPVKEQGETPFRVREPRPLSEDGDTPVRRLC